MRRSIKKEVVSTVVKVAKMEMVDGLPTALVLPNVVLLGVVSPDKAQKEIHKLHGKNVTVFSVEVETDVYEMDVVEFIKHAKLVGLEVEAESVTE